MQTTSMIVVFLALASCGSARKDVRGTPDDANAGARLPVAKPWTTQFEKATLLIADEVRIEGPDGLLDHLATRADATAHKKSERVTRDGFLQEIVLAPNTAPLEIRAFLDRYEIVALKKLSVLERPGPVDAVIVATGDVFLRDAASEAVQRAPVLRIDGKIQQ